MKGAGFKLWSADCLNREFNNYYPNRHVVTDADSFREAVRHDYVCAQYKGDRRSGGNFMETNCCPVDIDNTHTNNPDEWVTPADLAQLFPNPSHVPIMIAYHCGLRLGEVFGLTWDDVDLENGELTVNRQVQWLQDRAEYRLLPPKYGSVRTVRMDNVLWGLLKREKKKRYLHATKAMEEESVEKMNRMFG